MERNDGGETTEISETADRVVAGVRRHGRQLGRLYNERTQPESQRSKTSNR
jgi:hypothetical protein